ncbi:MAG: glycosyltransferase family 4 protein [Methanomicrobium sp.]|nr:glycosyltransferase family 4 protein [Methanomicrobium sp.]
MKILHATKKYPDAIGGDAVVVSNLESEQQRMGHEVFILTSRCHETVQKSNIFIYGITDMPSGLDKISIKRILSLLMLSFSGFFLLSRIKPDIIHAHSPDIGFILSFQAILFNIPVINTCHGVTFADRQFSAGKGRIELFLLKNGRFNKIVTVDKNSLPFFLKQNIKNACYISNGVDIDCLKREDNCRSSLSEFKYLFVGRLEDQKGLKYLFQATKKLSNKISNFKVIIVGDGSIYHYLAELVKSYEIDNEIEFAGRVGSEKLKEIYHSCDVFVLPSIWEGMPLTLLEAFACGLPVIVTDVGEISQICINKENAIIVSPKNPDELCRAMLMLYEDEELREKIGKNGEITVKSGYSWGEVAEKYLNLYHSALNLN